MLATSRLFSCEKAARFQKTITDNTTSRQNPLPFKTSTSRQQRPREFSKMTVAGFFSGLFGSGNGSEPQVGLFLHEAALYAIFSLSNKQPIEQCDCF